MSRPSLTNKRITSFVSSDIYELISESAHRKGMTMAEYVRGLLEKSHDVLPENVIAKSLVKIHTKMNRLERSLDILGEMQTAYLLSYFAQHPEIPADKRASVAMSSEKRMEQFMAAVVQRVRTSNTSLFSKLIADHIEEDVES